MSGSILANSNVEEIFESVVHHHSLVTKLSELRDDSRFRDVTLVAEGIRINAHRVVLAACSDYFKAMFTSEMRESRQQEIELFDVEAPALDALINFCYCGELQIEGINVPSVLHAACLLQLNEVKEACCVLLKRLLRPSNFLKIRALADIHSCQELLDYIDDYILKNFQELSGTDEFHQLSVNQMVQLLSNDELVVPSEEQVFTAVLQWVEFDSSSRKQMLPELLEHVRLPLCRPEFLVNTVCKNALVMADATCHNLVDQAKNDLILQLSSLECLQMKGRRFRACEAITGVIYVVGGILGRSVKYLDPESTDRVWQHAASLNRNWLFVGVAAFDKFIYAVGGRDWTTAINNNERYNSATDQWTSDVAPCPSDRCSFSVAGLEHHLYAVGGSEDCSPVTGEEYFRKLDIVERYDVLRNEWTSVAPMKSCREGLSVSVLDGCLYAMGGCNYDTVLNTVERLGPRVGRWEEVCPMSTPRHRPGSAVLHGELYVVGGCNEIRLSSAEKYDPRTNKWTSVADMSRSRDGLGLAAVSGKLYAIGGLLDDSVEVFDSKANLWKHHTNFNWESVDVHDH